ncbi:MAG: hypothetical protein M1546_11150 [Chloroflexi bacterium]|nr:hypothetical protein [Chloroflexota bacterium]
MNVNCNRRKWLFDAALVLSALMMCAACGAPAPIDGAAPFALAASAAVAPTSTHAPSSAPNTVTPANAATATVTPVAPASEAPPPSEAAPTATAEPQPQPAPLDQASNDQSPQSLDFISLYKGASITGPILSDQAKALHGRKVVMQGYMAPPLKPDIDFFVLTQTPMVYCPFCSTAADWPYNIVFVRMANGSTLPAMVPSQGIQVYGTLSVGVATDEATGFVSLVRIIADDVVPIR